MKIYKENVNKIISKLEIPDPDTLKIIKEVIDIDKIEFEQDQDEEFSKNSFQEPQCNSNIEEKDMDES